MVEAQPKAVIGLSQVGLSELKSKWGWIAGIGGLLIAAGIFAISASFITTLFSMVLMGWLMIFAGISVMINAFQCKQWGGFFLDLLMGILYTVVGFMIVGNPGATAVALTLIVAIFLLIGGLSRIVLSIMMRFPNGGLLLLHGVISLVLGISIWQNWPLSGLWVIGLFVGIEMLFTGLTLLMMGLSVKRLSSTEEVADAT
ncbi:MAG: HdeD family acid-resistance protein [Planctomycetota bacterium]